MIAIGKNPIEKKVYAYILKQKECQYQLLIFEHLDFPEAGVQIPGGTVESGKSVSAAALREIQEETGLKCINLFEKFGVSYHDMSRYGLQKIHERHYFHFDVCESTESAWMGYEETPSDGSPGPISLKFYWVNLDCVPLLAGRTDEMLPELIDRLKLEASDQLASCHFVAALNCLFGISPVYRWDQVFVKRALAIVIRFPIPIFTCG